MKQRGRKGRLELFRHLAGDLANAVFGKHDVVVCPLCLKEYDRSAAESGELTEEHVIPKSTGSQEVTLTCKSCNDRTGSEIDSHLARRVRLNRAYRRKSTLKGQLRINHEFGAPADVLVQQDGKVHIHIKPTTEHVQSKLLDALQRYASGERQVRFKIDYGLDMSKFAAAIAKAAYLGLFVDRGYRYILMPSLDRVRRAIREEGSDRIRLFDVIVPAHLTGFSDLPKAPDRLTFEAVFPGGVQACASLVNMGIESGIALVMLPPGCSVNTGSWDGLARAADTLRGKRELSLEMKPGGEVIVRGL